MNIERRFTLADHREEEAFLASEHAKGRRLVSKRRNIYIFEEAPEEAIEYLIELPAPGTKIDAWRAHREHKGFTYLFASSGVHYLRRPAKKVPFPKEDHAYRSAHIQAALVKSGLRAFFFIILGAVILFSPFPPEATLLKVLLALLSVVGVIFFTLRAMNDYMMSEKLDQSLKDEKPPIEE